LRADPEKIRLMADLAIFEKNNEKNVFKVNEYYRSDYIMWHTLLAFLRYTIMSLFAFVIYVIFRADLFFYNVNLDGITKTLSQIGIYYLIGAAAYILISVIVYATKYQRARKGILLYATKLKRLARNMSHKKVQE